MSSLGYRVGCSPLLDVMGISQAFDTSLFETIPHLGTSLHVRFMQNDTFAPLYRYTSGTPVFYALLREGPFVIRLDSDLSQPMIAKLEINGKMYGSEFRIPPRGSRTIREVHEPHLAATKSLRFPIPPIPPIPDRKSRRGDPKRHVSLCRLVLLGVRGGEGAARDGRWVAEKRPVEVCHTHLIHNASCRARSPTPTASDADGGVALHAKMISPFAPHLRRSSSRSRSQSSAYSRSPSGEARRGPSHFHICVRCNSTFDRERRMYEEIIETLQRQVRTLEEEGERLRARGERYRGLVEESAHPRVPPIPLAGGKVRRSFNVKESLPSDRLAGTLTPRRRELLTGTVPLSDTESAVNTTPSSAPLSYQTNSTEQTENDEMSASQRHSDPYRTLSYSRIDNA